MAESNPDVGTWRIPKSQYSLREFLSGLGYIAHEGLISYHGTNVGIMLGEQDTPPVRLEYDVAANIPSSLSQIEKVLRLKEILHVNDIAYEEPQAAAVAERLRDIGNLADRVLTTSGG